MKPRWSSTAKVRSCHLSAASRWMRASHRLCSPRLARCPSVRSRPSTRGATTPILSPSPSRTGRAQHPVPLCSR
ncbi:hypothetical protein ACFPRL_09125 [Pseudoclavibacter helvolus]